MKRGSAVRLLDRLHDAQNEFYAGRASAGLEDLLAPDITWIVPGKNRIAGTYRAVGQVLDYFQLRRALADGTFQMTRRDVLGGEDGRLAPLTDGTATIGGVHHEWSTGGLYETEGERIASCRLLALEQATTASGPYRCSSIAVVQ